tara:strand:- start:68 stop:334 length:267 start_codon:yes stop_codon:yes gene_type:complete
MEKYLNKLRYRSWHRGTKEADLLLGKFFDLNIENFNKNTYILYEDFLNIINDNDLLLIVKGQKNWPKSAPKEITNLLDKYILSEGFRK